MLVEDGTQDVAGSMSPGELDAELQAEQSGEDVEPGVVLPTQQVLQQEVATRVALGGRRGQTAGRPVMPRMISPAASGSRLQKVGRHGAGFFFSGQVKCG